MVSRTMRGLLASAMVMVVSESLYAQTLDPVADETPLPIKISMPDGEFGECKYRLATGASAWNFTIRPGQSQVLQPDRRWEITFERGLGAAKQTYRLNPGHYRFRQIGIGWELYQMPTMVSEPIPLAPVPLPESSIELAGQDRRK